MSKAGSSAKRKSKGTNQNQAPTQTQNNSNRNKPQEQPDPDDDRRRDDKTDPSRPERKDSGGRRGSRGSYEKKGGGGRDRPASGARMEAGYCDFCNPCGCGMCNIPLRYGTFSFAIYFLIWCILWALGAVSPFIQINKKKRRDYDNSPAVTEDPGHPVCWIEITAPVVLAIAALVCTIFLLIGTVKEKKCFVKIWVIGVIVGLVFSLMINLTLGIWRELTEDEDSVTCPDLNKGYQILVSIDKGGEGILQAFTPRGSYMPLGMCLWLWYPWWVAYAYMVELGANSWCGCC